MRSSPVQFEINANSGVPIYRQLVDQVHALVAGDRLRPGDLLPSVRQVAVAASINPMTVSKAYARLEADGTVERLRGQGMRVKTPTFDASLPRRKKEFRELLQPAIHRARQLGLKDKQVREVVESLLKELSS